MSKVSAIRSPAAVPKRQEYSQPVEGLALRREDGVDRQRSLAGIPERECRGERDAERNGRRFKPDAEIIDEIVGDQRTDDADEHDRQPIGPGHVALLGKLQDQRDDQYAGHEQRGGRQAETKVDGKVVGRRLAHGHRHELYQPEIDRDVGNPVDGPVQHLGWRTVA